MKSILRAVKDFGYALAYYEDQVRTKQGQPSYSVIERPKIQIANALLHFFGLPTEPRI